MSKPNSAEADMFRKGLATVAQQDGASAGDVVTVSAEGELEMNAPGGSLPDPITQPVTIALPHGDAHPLVATAADLPNALIDLSIGADGTATVVVSSDGAGNAVLAAVDFGTQDGQIKWETEGSYVQPRSDSADSAQTIEIVDTSGNDALVYQAGGSLIFGRKTVIPDGNLVAGQFGFWLDDTNGAAKLMVKAKSANGTVVTGEVPLT